MPDNAAVDNRSPREKLLQARLDAKTDLEYGFGDYVQLADNETDNSMRERTRGAIALMPAGNREGSWWFLVLKTMKPVKRNKAEKVAMPDVVINYLNDLADAERRSKSSSTSGDIHIGTWRTLYDESDTEEADEEPPQDDNDYDGSSLPARIVPQRGVVHLEDDDGEASNDEDAHVFAADDFVDDDFANDYHRTGNNFDDIFGPDSDSEDNNGAYVGRGEEYAEPQSAEVDDNPGMQEIHPGMHDNGDAAAAPDPGVQELATGDMSPNPGVEFPATGEEQQQQRAYSLRHQRAQPGRWRGVATAPTSTRNRRARNSGVRHQFNSARNAFLKRTFGLHMSVRQGIQKLGIEAIKSVVKEMMQHVDRRTFVGVNIDELSEEQLRLIITSSTFLKEKYTAQGLFDKLKARLVAGGHLQDRTVYDESALPTASTTSVFITAAIAAKENRAVATIVVPGAYLNSTMPDDEPPVLMRLNKFETRVLVKIEPEFGKFVNSNGTCVVRLKRALYGCVQSARLWYQKLSSDLISLGFVKNKLDECVFNRLEADGKQSTIVLHVDDMLITASSEERIDTIKMEIEALYSSLSVHRGRKVDYLGMTFDFTQPGKCRVTMNGYITDLLKFCDGIKGTAKTPAQSDLFDIDESSKVLGKADAEFYH